MLPASVYAEVLVGPVHQTPSLRLPDAFVLATGEELDAAVVLTADGAWPKLSARVRLI